jgi:hypothetical protein
MRRFQGFVHLLVFMVLVVATVLPALAEAPPMTDKPFDGRWADIIRHVNDKASAEGVLQSLEVKRMTYSSIIIDKIDGKSVCAKANAMKAKRLQELFGEEPVIYENSGPGLATITDQHGAIRTIKPLGGKCEPIFVSIRPE